MGISCLILSGLKFVQVKCLISFDFNGLILGLKVTHDILGQQITGNPDMGAIEQKTKVNLN